MILHYAVLNILSYRMSAPIQTLSINRTTQPPQKKAFKDQQ